MDKAKMVFYKHKQLFLLFLVFLALCFATEGLCRNKPSGQKKHIRLYVIAFGMKGQPQGLQQLKDISNAGHAKFSAADNFKQLEEAFARVSEDTSTIIVKWPKTNHTTINPTPYTSPSSWSDPWVKALSIILIFLSLATGTTAYVLFRPSFIILISEPDRKERRTRFHKRSIWIGRDSSCNVSVKDPTASRRHLKVSIKKEGVGFRDNNTENGTFIKGEKVTEGMLMYGRKITIGKTQLKVIRQRKGEINK